MVKINVLKSFHFEGLNFPHLKAYCSFSWIATMTSVVLQIRHRCSQIFKKTHSTTCLVQSSGRLQDDTMAPHTQLLIQLPQTAYWKKQCCSPPSQKICKRKVRRACNWGLLLWPNIQATRLFNCHFQASQWSRGICMTFLLPPGICDSPLHTGGKADCPPFKCFVCLFGFSFGFKQSVCPHLW